ncbi:MAG TPA: DUF1697 domain-containing protein [Candidatus Thermoplasmatota archaeon]|nr:DUF1697 domain-containing protein [Candidatus Thermoplasmatota archaeon]
MARYVAFLRAVNVVGQNVLTMDELRRLLARIGLEGVSTHGASGNVIFDAEPPKAETRAAIETALRRRLRKDVVAILRTPAELARTVRAAPFDSESPKTPRRFVTFLADGRVGALPPATRPGDPEFLGSAGRDVFSLLTIEGGRFRDPTLALERAFGTKATTRSWRVVQDVAARARTR